MAQTRLFCLPLVCRLQCKNYLLNTHFKMFRSWSANWILEINNGFLVIFLNCYQDINANNILRYLKCPEILFVGSLLIADLISLLFVYDSVLVGCMFLLIYIFLPGCPVDIQLCSSSYLMFLHICVCGCVVVHACLFSHSVVSDSLQPFGLQPIRLLYPWNFPGKNNGVDGHFLLQGTLLSQGQNSCLLCLLLQVDSLSIDPSGIPGGCCMPLSLSFFFFF